MTSTVITSSTGNTSVGGLASGMDTDAIVSALVAVKTARIITPYETKVTDLNDKISMLSAFKDLMGTMKTTASTLSGAYAFRGRSSTSSDEDVLSVTSTSTSAAKGSYSVLVSALAQADRNYFTGVADTTATQFGTGTFSITSDSTTVTVAITAANNTLQGIADAINATDDTPVYAAIVNDGSASTPYRLVLTSRSTGADSDITQNIAATLTGLSNDAALNALTSNQGQDAAISINGLSITSDSNSFTDAIPGLTFSVSQLYTTAASPLRVTVSDDTAGMLTKVTDFITAYNDLIAGFQDQFTYSADTGSLGILGNDLTLQSAQTALNGIVIGVYNSLAANAYQSSASIGITMDENGLLEVDEDALQAALDTDLTAVATLFQGTSAADGIADRAYDYLYTLINGADGIITQRLQQYDANVSTYEDKITENQDIVDAYESTLQAKFAYMEEVLSTLNSQSDSFEAAANALENLNSNND